MDEVHFLENWSFTVKKYFDKRFPIKFVISSSSASLFKKTAESLAGRTIEEVILPFSFKEFVLYSLRDDEQFNEAFRQDKLTPYEDKLQILFKAYTRQGGFPHLLEVRDPYLWRKLLREDVVEKVIYRDLVQLYGIRTPEKLERTFLYLTDITAQLLNISTLARYVGISRQHMERFIQYLSESYLVFLLRRFSPSASKTIRGLPKVHVIDPGLCGVLSISPDYDFILESMVARDLMDVEGRVYFYRNNFEIDIVFDNFRESIPIEVKNKIVPESADFKGVIQFMKRFNSRRGVLLCQEYKDVYEKEGIRIDILPIWWWLLKKEEILLRRTTNHEP
jgi:predicted AAA+ superfamily ATPase